MTALEKPQAICLMGPTASGKTGLGIAMAQVLNAEIISVDSALVYKGMDIGTAKPSLIERGGVPHHLIDILEPNAAFSTGQFRSKALTIMADIVRRGKRPLLVGGTMLYFSALTQGLAKLPEADASIRERLNQELFTLGSQVLHDRLAQIDPLAAARIHVNDPQRVQRALEVYEISGRSLSSFFEAEQDEQAFRYLKLIVAPHQRQALHDKIAFRFKRMLAQGFLDEVKALQARGDLDLSMPSLRCVGYRQAWSYLHGACDFDTMQEQAIIATRQLAKRQFTWLRKEEHALQLISDDPNLLETALSYCRTNA